MFRHWIRTLFKRDAPEGALLSPASFIAGAREGLAAQTSAHAAGWRFGEEERWEVDMEKGRLVLHFADGTVASAPIQVVGTYQRADSSFLWAWEHPSVPPELARHAEITKAWAGINQLGQFTTAKPQCTEDEAWDFAATVNRLNNTNGAYRGSAGTTLVYMTFGDMTLQRAGAA